MNQHNALGLVIGLCAGIIIGINYKFLLRFFGVLNSYRVVIFPIIGIGFYSYLYTEDALFIASLLAFIVSNFVLTDFLSKKTFLNKDEAGCIVLGFFADLLFGYAAINDYINGFSEYRALLAFLCVVLIQAFAYKKGFDRKISLHSTRRSD